MPPPLPKQKKGRPLDECDDAHVAAAVDTLKRVDLVREGVLGLQSGATGFLHTPESRYAGQQILRQPAS